MSVQYDAKIAFTKDQLSIVVGTNSDHPLVTPKYLFEKTEMYIETGDVLVPIRVCWEEKRLYPKEKFPTLFPLKQLVPGKEGKVVNVTFQGETFKFLCAQQEYDQRNFENVFLGKATAIYHPSQGDSLQNTFDFGKYVSKIARRMIPKISMPPALPRIAPDLEGTFAKRRHICRLDSPEQTGETLKLRVISIIDPKRPVKEVSVPRQLVEVCSGWFKTMLGYPPFSKATELDVKCEDIALFEQTMAFLSTNTLDPKITLGNLLGLIELDYGLDMDPNIAPIYPLCVSLIEKMLSKHDLKAVLHVAFKTHKRELMDICAEFLKQRKHSLGLMPDFLLTEIKANLYNPFPAVEFCCKHLRKQLISLKNPAMWLTVFEFLESNKDAHPALKQLKDACVALAIHEPKILAGYTEENSTEKLREIKDLEILKQKAAEAKLLECKVVMDRITAILQNIA